MRQYRASIVESGGADTTVIEAVNSEAALTEAIAWAKAGNWDCPGSVVVVLYDGEEAVDSRRIAVGA